MSPECEKYSLRAQILNPAVGIEQMITERTMSRDSSRVLGA